DRFPFDDGDAGTMGFIGFVVRDPVGLENRPGLMGWDNRRGKICWCLSGRNQQSPATEEDGGRCNSQGYLKGWVHGLYRLFRRMLMGLAPLGNL
ncbi:MAG: hypothetical protein HOI67_15210, partial [Gammaproteobacteria bacterium]|nr:hypothetical protein [Gammaproteobacteria bacterium]